MKRDRLEAILQIVLSLVLIVFEYDMVTGGGVRRWLEVRWDRLNAKPVDPYAPTPTEVSALLQEADRIKAEEKA